MCALLFMAAPGSIQILGRAPAAHSPAWAQPCLAQGPQFDAQQLAFCARVDGRVIATQSKRDGETHLLVLGGFHVTLVELPDRAHMPSWGSRVVAVGPMQAASHGLREVKAITLWGG